MTSEAPRPTLIKLDNSHYLLDRWRDWLVEAGFQVIRVVNFREALRLVRRVHPVLILIADDQPHGMDAIEWLELQHADADPVLPMIPLLIVADRKQGEEVRLQELPHRVRVLLRPVDATILVKTVKEMLGE